MALLPSVVTKPGYISPSGNYESEIRHGATGKIIKPRFTANAPAVAGLSAAAWKASADVEILRSLDTNCYIGPSSHHTLAQLR